MRVLVTASTRGIGRGIAEVLLAEGSRVAVNGRTRASVEKAVNELSEGGEVVGCPGDLASRESVKSVVECAAQGLGGLDALVYVAGPPRPGRFQELGERDWEHAARLLALSPVWAAMYALPYLLESPSPSMVFLTSVATKEPLEDIALSNVMRISVHGLVKTLARELGPRGVRVNAVLPGYIMTDRVRQLARSRAEERGTSVEEELERIAGAVPLRRIGEPREVGMVVAFLLSPYASYVNGASIPVDGGLLRSVF
jgi:3-oxoacyl-[acyl-carrier protein] reductase